MPFFVVDDGADSHPKMIRAKNAAVGLWTRVGSYVARQLTDGHVPGEIARMYGSAPQIRKLVEVGLWHDSKHTCGRCPAVRPGDYFMHDYAESGNPSRAEVLARRKREADKKRAYRDRQAGQQMRLDDPPPPPRRQPEPQPAPARAVIPADWEPTPDDVRAAQLARAEDGLPQLTADQVDAVTRKFVRRMLDDGARAAAWGGRWQQWAESERTAPPPGGNVVHLPARPQYPSGAPMSTADQRAAAAYALSQELAAEENR
jgi:hypothetical protein